MPMRLLVAAIALSSSLASVARTQMRAPRRLTLDALMSDSVRHSADLPITAWLATGALMIEDVRVPARQRTIELLDPRAGTRRPAVDAAHAVTSLNALLPAAGRVNALDWPDDFDASGSHALYTIDGDLFVLDLPASAFTRLTHTPAEEHAAQFSPNGRSVSFVRDNDLYVIDLQSRRETRLTHDGSATMLNGTPSWMYWEEVFGRRDVGYWWSPDSRRIAYLQSDEAKVPLATFVDTRSVMAPLITQRYPLAGTPNPVVRVGVLDVSDASHRTTWMHVTSGNGLLLRVNWLPDAKQVALETLTRDQHTLSLFFADAATGTAAHILDEHDSAWVNVHDDLHFIRGGREFLWASERDGYYHIYRYDDSGKLLNQVTSGDRAEAASGGLPWVRQAVVGVDEARDWMYFTSMRESPLERHLYRVHLDGSGLTRLTTEAGTHEISMSPDAHWFVDVRSTIRSLPELSLRDADATRTVLGAVGDTAILSAYDVQFPQLTTIPARDGFEMPAAILRPRDFQPNRRYPVIMEVYGGASSPIVENASSAWTLVYQLMLDRGFVVVQVDNRAATALSKRLENVSYGTVGRSEVADLGDAARWLGAQSWVDSSRIGVWGWSNGGYVTLNLLTRTTLFKAGIAVAPVTDWRYYDSKWAEAFLGDPRSNAAGYDSASVVLRAAALHGRLLLVHGSYDDNVNPRNEQVFIDALVRAGKTFDYMVYPMRKHDIRDRAARRHLYETMLEFWLKNLD